MQYCGTQNHVDIIGGLKALPELHETPYGLITTIYLATKRPKKYTETGWGVEAEWHRIVLKNKQVEYVLEHGVAGMLFNVKGFLRTKIIPSDDDGLYRQTEIVAEHIRAFTEENIFHPQEVAHAA